MHTAGEEQAEESVVVEGEVGLEGGEDFAAVGAEVIAKGSIYHIFPFRKVLGQSGYTAQDEQRPLRRPSSGPEESVPGLCTLSSTNVGTL